MSVAPAGHGLTVRWSLAAADPDVADRLRDYVLGTSVDRFTGWPGMVQKTWHLGDGWFAGSYVFATAAARAELVERMRTTPSPIDAIVRSTPASVEEHEVVAVAHGDAGPLA